jgi:HK97 family phage major capsid protein
MWGLPVVSTTSIAQGTALVGAFRMGAQIFRRMGLTIKTTNSDGSKFLSNILTIVAEERLALAVYQPNKFCSITSIP